MLREELATMRGFLSNENNILEVMATGMEHRTPGTKQYTVTYSFDEEEGGARPRPIERILATARSMKRDKLMIAFLGAIQVVDEAGRLRMVMVRFEASTQGVIGILNCRSELPACGAPQIIETDTSGKDGINSGVVVEVGS